MPTATLYYFLQGRLTCNNLIFMNSALGVLEQRLSIRISDYKCLKHYLFKLAQAHILLIKLILKISLFLY